MKKLKLTSEQRRLLEKRRKKGIVRLEELEVEKVDLVETPANLQNFLIVKDFQTRGQTMLQDIVEIVANSDGSYSSVTKSNDVASDKQNLGMPKDNITENNLADKEVQTDISEKKVSTTEPISEKEFLMDKSNEEVTNNQLNENNVASNNVSNAEMLEESNVEVKENTEVENEANNSVENITSEISNEVAKDMDSDGSDKCVSTDFKSAVLSFLDALLMETYGLLHWLKNMDNGIQEPMKYVKVPQILSNSLIKMSRALFIAVDDLKRPINMKSFIDELYAVKPIFKQQDDSLRVELIAVLMQSKEILSKIYFTISDLPSSCKGKDFILTETAINSLLNVAVDFQNIAKKCSTFEDKDNAEKSLESDIKEKRVKKEDIIKHLEENNFSEDQLEQMRGIFAPMLKSAESVKSGNTSTTTEGKETNTETEIVEENTETASDVKDEVIETLKSLQSGQKDIMERFEKQTNSTEQITKEFKELGDKFEITQKELNLIKETVEQIGKKTPTSKNIKGQELDHGKPEDKGTFSGVFFNGLK